MVETGGGKRGHKIRRLGEGCGYRSTCGRSEYGQVTWYKMFKELIKNETKFLKELIKIFFKKLIFLKKPSI